MSAMRMAGVFIFMRIDWQGSVQRVQAKVVRGNDEIQNPNGDSSAND